MTEGAILLPKVDDYPQRGLLCDCCASPQVCQSCFDGPAKIHYLCDNCFEDNPIGKWDAKVNWMTFGLNRPYVGVELEVVPDGGYRKTLAKRLMTSSAPSKFIYIQHDGSIRDNSAEEIEGLEIVGAPASYDFHLTAWDWLEELSNKMRVNEGCGMHIHLDRWQMSKLQLGKMIKFLYAEENYVLVRTIAGRWNPRFANLDDNRPLTDGVLAEADYQKLKKEPPPRRLRLQREHYRGLNLSNPHTVELRIFAPTIDREEILKNIEFALALAEFTKPSARSFKECVNRKIFLNYVKQRPKRFPYLYAFLERVGL